MGKDGAGCSGYINSQEGAPGGVSRRGLQDYMAKSEKEKLTFSCLSASANACSSALALASCASRSEAWALSFSSRAAMEAWRGR